MEAAARNSAGEKGEQKDEWDSTEHVAWRSSVRHLWLCYAVPLAEKQKSEISGKRHRPKPIPCEKNS